MRLELSEDTAELCRAIAEYGAARIAPFAADWDRAWELPPHARAGLGEQGLLGLCLAEADGGLELPLGDALAVLETLAGFDGSIALTAMVHNLGGARQFAAAAKTRPGLSDGTELLGLADLDDPSEPVVATRRGDRWQLRGRKRRVILGRSASHTVVWATDDAGQSLAFAVPAGASGFDVERPKTLGLRAADLGRADLRDVDVSAALELGPVASGAAQAIQLGFAAIATGLASAALRVATAYAKEREQFGKPISSFQAIQWKLANLAVGRDAARLMIGVAAHGGLPGAAEAAAVKACGVAVAGASDALQIHGGYGYTTEFPVERMLRDARACAACIGGAAARQPVADAVAARFGG